MFGGGLGSEGGKVRRGGGEKYHNERGERKSKRGMIEGKFKWGEEEEDRLKGSTRGIITPTKAMGKSHIL